MVKIDLKYLLNKPKRINYFVVAGSPITYYESYDLIFDKYDMKIRKLKDV